MKTARLIFGLMLGVTSAVIDTEQFVANAKKFGEYCAEHPNVSLITATDELFGSSRTADQTT